MKKYILYLAALMMVLASCSDSEEVDIKYQVNLTISPAQVISGLTEYKNGDFKLMDGYKVRVRSLIYNIDGDLVNKTEELIKDYSSDLNFSVVLPIGNYTIVSSTDVVEANSLSDISTKYWTFSGENKLSGYKVQNEGLWGLGQDMLGLTQTQLDVTEVTTKIIKVQPVTALVESHISNIHANRSLLYASIQYQFTNDIISYIDGLWNYTTSSASTDYFELQRIDLTDSEYDDMSGVYYYGAVLPSEDKKFVGYVMYVNSDGKVVEGTTKSSVTLSFESGKQYKINFDLSTLTLSSTVITKSKSSPISLQIGDKKNSNLAPKYSYNVRDILRNKFDIK